MSKIFIVWSGNLELANIISNKIQHNNKNYECIIGGDSQGKESIYVGDTIIKQMSQCDQAILLIQKNDKGLSPNIMFEWGYLLARLNLRKIFKYFIDVGENDPIIPSDIKGVWANLLLSSSECSQEEIAEKICKDFFSRQSLSIEGNKMSVVLDWYKTKYIICNHAKTPICTDYEIAQNVILYTYSGKFFSNILDNVAEDIKMLQRDCNNFDNTSELGIILKASRLIIRFLKSIKPFELANGNEVFYIEEDDYEEYQEIFEYITKSVDMFSDGEAKLLFKVLINNYIVYMNLLMLYNPDISTGDKVMYSNRMNTVCATLISDCEKLEKLDEHNNKQLVWLILAYTYRSIFCSIDELELEDSKKDEKENNLRLSLDYRTRLYSYYKGENVNGEFFDSVEMEYFLSLAEYYKYESDKEKKREINRKLNKYIAKSQRISKSKKICISIIMKYLSEK